METNNNTEDRRERREEARQEAKDLLRDAKLRDNRSTGKINRLWLWLGVIVLIFILFYWLFSIGIFEDAIGFFNG